jgi:hypothetical protein
MIKYYWFLHIEDITLMLIIIAQFLTIFLLSFAKILQVYFGYAILPIRAPQIPFWIKPMIQLIILIYLETITNPPTKYIILLFTSYAILLPQEWVVAVIISLALNAFTIDYFKWVLICFIVNAVRIKCVKWWIL